ncbi:SGNH/GDSL hydrolase family protein [Paenibacillus sp. MY03]|uniref:SGNH/GDSL hydrolase family protein n=1 Tax=Paenibacillus sp. MY03 TaxID=302980 RepID=UPI0026AB6CD7
MPLGDLGSIGDTAFNDRTFYGALRKAIEFLHSARPELRILMLTPLHKDHSSYDVNFVNGAGHRLAEYEVAIKKIGVMYAIPVYDAFALSGITKINLEAYTLDGLHPNDAGYRRITRGLIPFIDAFTHQRSCSMSRYSCGATFIILRKNRVNAMPD